MNAATRTQQVDPALLMGVVHRIARAAARKAPSTADVDELVGAGALGLAQAWQRWDDSNPDAFMAYAVTRIRGAILDELRKMDPLSRGQRQMVARLAETEHRVSAAKGRRAARGEIAKDAGMTLSRYDEAAQLANARHHVSLDEHGDVVLGQPRPGDAEQALVDSIEAKYDWERLQTALSHLPERLETVIRLYFEQDMLLREVGAYLGVTEARASQLRTEAIRRLRELLASDESEDPRAAAPGRRHETRRSAPSRARSKVRRLDIAAAASVEGELEAA